MNSDTSLDDNIETDYNNYSDDITNQQNEISQEINFSVENISNLLYSNNSNLNELSDVHSEEVNYEDSDNNSEGQGPYTQLFDNNPDNPFFKCKINRLDYETDEDENNNFLRIIVSWNFEYNYDYFSIIDIKCFMSKNDSFKKNLQIIKDFRNNNNSNSTGMIQKINNCDFNINNEVHIYLIVYYDNAKCNIELYGIFNQDLEEEKLLNNIINEKSYGKKGKLVSNTFSTSTGGDGFIVIHNMVKIE